MEGKLEQKLLSLAEAAQLRSTSQDYLRILIFRGKLKAVKLGRNWHTTEEWLGEHFSQVNGNGVSRARPDDTIASNLVKSDLGSEVLQSKETIHAVEPSLIVPKVIFSLVFTAFVVGAFTFPYISSFIDDTMGDTLLFLPQKRNELAFKRLPEISPTPFSTLALGTIKEILALREASRLQAEIVSIRREPFKLGHQELKIADFIRTARSYKVFFASAAANPSSLLDSLDSTLQEFQLRLTRRFSNLYSYIARLVYPKFQVRIAESLKSGPDKKMVHFQKFTETKKSIPMFLRTLE